MKSKQNSSRISLTKGLGSDDCKSNIHNPNLSCDIVGMKSNDEFPTLVILPITSNVLMHDNLMPQPNYEKYAKNFINRIDTLNGNMNIGLVFNIFMFPFKVSILFMKFIVQCSLKTITNIFYKHNIHPMLNTQKLHDQLKRLRKSPQTN